MSSGNSLLLSKTDLLSELSVKECILGLMRVKDIDRNGIIHSSDFRSAIEEVGMDLGNKLVQDMLVKCSIDTKGNINYSSLEKALSDERSILLAKRGHTAIQTSLTAVEKPLRADIAHKQKIQGEKNFRSLQANRLAILDVYQRYVNAEITVDQLISEIAEFDIEITTAFRVLMRKHHAARSASFSEVLRALSTVETSHEHLTLGTTSHERREKESDGDIHDLHRRRRFSKTTNTSNMSQILAGSNETHSNRSINHFTNS